MLRQVTRTAGCLLLGVLITPLNAAEKVTSHRIAAAPTAQAEARRPVVDPALAESSLVEEPIDEATLRQLLEDVKTNTELLSAHTKDIGELQGWRNELRETLETQRKILEAISRTDASGQIIPRMDQNSDDFRRDLRTAVQDTYQRTGQVVIRNSTSRTQEVWINNQRHFIEPAQTRDFTVSAGTATVEVPDGDRTSWSIGPPDYKAEMTLVPDDRRTTTYRPLSPLPAATSVPAMSGASTYYYYATPTEPQYVYPWIR